MMKNIIVQPSNQKQSLLLKDLLNEMNVKFITENKKTNNTSLSNFEKKLIDKGLEDIEWGRTKTQQEAHKIFQKCFK